MNESRTATARERQAAEPEPRVTCATCGCNHFHPIDTRPCIGGIMRRLACRHCARRISVRENEIQQVQAKPTAARA